MMIRPIEKLARYSRHNIPLWILLGMTVLGFVGLILYGVPFEKPLQISSVGIMTAVAMFVIGGLTGFLFGIPRTLQLGVTQNGEDPHESQRASYRANTNLEQISDWLTKILVGIGLTKLLQLPDKIWEWSGTISSGLGGEPGSQLMSLAILTYFPICGFLFGYLWTRLNLAGALEQADLGFKKLLREFISSLAKIEVKLETGEEMNIKDEIQAIRQVAEQELGALSHNAAQARIQLDNLAREYERLRSTMNYGNKRTTKMNEVVAQARALATQVNFKQEEFESRFKFDSPDGDRLVTLGLLQVIQEPQAFSYLVEILERPRSSFEQYNALLVFQRMVFMLSDNNRNQLGEVLKNLSEPTEENKARWKLKKSILEELGVSVDQNDAS